MVSIFLAFFISSSVNAQSNIDLIKRVDQLQKEVAGLLQQQKEVANLGQRASQDRMALAKMQGDVAGLSKNQGDVAGLLQKQTEDRLALTQLQRDVAGLRKEQGEVANLLQKQTQDRLALTSQITQMKAQVDKQSQQLATAPIPVSAAVITDLTAKVTALTQQQAARPDPKLAIDALTSQITQMKAQVDKQIQQLATVPVPAPGVSAAVITDLTAKINTLSTRTNALPDQVNELRQKTQRNFSVMREAAGCGMQVAQTIRDRRDLVMAGQWIERCNQQILSNLQN